MKSARPLNPDATAADPLQPPGEGAGDAAGWQDRCAPGIAEIEAMAEAALAALPPAFHAAAEGVLVRVEELADDETLATLGLEDPYELTGLYDGRALTTRSTDDLPTLPDTVWLYRRAILDEWIDRGDVTLGALVTHVLVHEIAHHLGWSDADIAAIDPWWT